MAFLRLPTFTQIQQFVDADGKLTPAAMRTLNDALKQILEAVNSIAALPEIQQALLDLDAATQAALDAASTAQTAAEDITATSALTASYVTGLTLGSADAGTDVTISISGHMRVYGDGTSVSVNSGNVTGAAYDTYYYIYYDDPTRAGGTVTYSITADEAVAAQTGARHVVGAVVTPVAGQPDNTGYPVRPPGSGTIEREAVA